MIKNESGQVAVKLYPPAQRPILVRGEMKYVMTISGNIAMAWIDEEDVEKILSIRGCNCGTMARQSFTLATQEEVDLWTS